MVAYLKRTFPVVAQTQFTESNIVPTPHGMILQYVDDGISEQYEVKSAAR